MGELKRIGAGDEGLGRFVIGSDAFVAREAKLYRAGSQSVVS